MLRESEMKRMLWLLFVLFVASGCAVNPIPKGYTGPTAMIKYFVGVEPEEHPGTPMYYVSKIDEQQIENSESGAQFDV
jgi:hypothetical protein